MWPRPAMPHTAVWLAQAAGNSVQALQSVARYDHGPGQTVRRGGPRE